MELKCLSCRADQSSGSPTLADLERRIARTEIAVTKFRRRGVYIGTVGFAARMIPIPPSISDKWQDIIDWFATNIF